MATTDNSPRTASEQTPNAWDQKELGCMWKKEKKGTSEKYLTGVLNLKNIPGFPDQDVAFVVFSNKRKLKETHPDLRIYVSEKRTGGTAPATTSAPAATRKATPAAAPVSDANELI
jgi:hypothetical protein